MPFSIIGRNYDRYLSLLIFLIGEKISQYKANTMT